MSNLRVLLCHNRYRLRGGEDSVFESEVALLRSRGHEVLTFEKDNADMDRQGRLAAASNSIWSQSSSRDFKSLATEFRPNVVHVHNTFAQISPSIYWAADQLRIPVVQTLHNFRLICPQAMLLRDGAICEDCVGKVPWRGAFRGCYRGSIPESSVLASLVTVHRLLGTWRDKICRYIALNEFCRQKFIDGGLPADKIVVKPNFVDAPEAVAQSRSGFLFVGRLSHEKGIRILIDAMKALPGAQLRVAGTGPEENALVGIKGLNAVGSLSGEGIRHEMTSAAALILPSIWYENFPRTLVEAFSCGLPVIASRIGALAELIEEGVTGLLFDPGDPADLAAKMQWALNNPEQLTAMGYAARRHYDQNFTADRNYQQLIDIYDDAIASFHLAGSQ